MLTMIRRSILLGAGLLLVTALPAAANDPGAERFKAVCMACHKLDRGPQMLAPPAFAVQNHYLRMHPEQGAFVQAVVDWVRFPDINRTLMPGAVRRFNLMPPLSLPEQELRAIAAFLYRAKFQEPEWYREHFEAEHGRH